MKIKMQKIKKKSTNTKKATNKKKMRIKTFCNIWKTLMVNCLKNKITVKILSFINEFDCAMNEEDKEKVVKKLKDTSDIANRDIDIMNEDNEYRPKLIGIVNDIDCFLCEYSKK